MKRWQFTTHLQSNTTSTHPTHLPVLDQGKNSTKPWNVKVKKVDIQTRYITSYCTDSLPVMSLFNPHFHPR